MQKQRIMVKSYLFISCLKLIQYTLQQISSLTSFIREHLMNFSTFLDYFPYLFFSQRLQDIKIQDRFRTLITYLPNSSAVNITIIDISLFHF